MKLMIKDIHCIEVGPRQTQVSLILENFNTHDHTPEGRIDLKNESFLEVMDLKGKIINVTTD